MRRSKHRKIHFNHQHAVALAILSLSLAAYWWLKTQGDVSLLRPEGLKQAINGYGIAGILVYISVIALAVIISPIPGAPLTVAAGAVWGAFWAGRYSVIGGLDF